MQHNVDTLADICLANSSGLDRQHLQSKKCTMKRNSLELTSKHHVTSPDYTAWRNLIKWILPVVNHQITRQYSCMEY